MFALLAAACGPPVPERGSGASGAAAVSFEPSAEPSAVASVVHIHVASTTLGAGQALLFQGSLSDYYLTKVRHGEVPDTLLARQVPLLSWRTESELVIAPLPALPLGPYALVSPSGLLVEFQVAAEAHLLRRIWPPSGLAGSPRFALYCADSAPLPSSAAIVLEPSGLDAQLAPGVDAAGTFADRCLSARAAGDLEADQIVVPPPSLEDWALDPAPFSSSVSKPALPIACLEGEVALGLGCAAVADDRAVVRTPDSALLWVAHTPRGTFVEVTNGGAPFALRGLSPDSHEHLWGTVHDASGTELGFDVFVDTAAARARPVLNEVLANPLGPEPQAEWIEVMNDGALALDLSSYALEDGGGVTALPAAVLAPQEYALLVRNDFAPNASDAPPAPGTRLVRMPTLGKSGLANGGERLALLDGAGQACSVMPALPTKAGQSLARRYPWSLDTDPHAFSYGDPTPGASNGAPPGS